MSASIARILCITAALAAVAGFTASGASATGVLDPTFGSGGIVTRDVVPGLIPQGTEITASLLLSGGETIVAGRLDDDIFVARFTAAGALDPSFGGLRAIDANAGSSPDDVRGLAIDGSGRVVVGGRADNSGFILRLTTSGQLDTSFGSGGRIIVTDPGGVQISDVETTSGDAIYAVASGYPSRVFKYDSTGSLDSSFGAAGISTAASGMNDTKLALDLNGRVVVAGSDSGSSANYRVYRLQGPSDPSPGFYDTTFDTDGISEVTGGAGGFIDVEVTTSNRPILLGDGPVDGFELVMLTFAGAPDATFDTDGFLSLDPLAGSTESPNDLVVDAGLAYVGGSKISGLTNRGFVTSITSSGALDVSFGGADATIEPGCESAATECPITAIATNSANLAFAADEREVPSANRIYLGSVDWFGAFRPTFDTDGKAFHQQQRPWDSTVSDSFMAADGSIYSVGEYGEYGDYETYVYKQTPTGAPDPAFGVGGTVTYDFLPTSDDYVSQIVAAGDGSVYVLGTDLSVSPAVAYIAKFNASGLDVGSGFGAGGVATVGVAPGDFYGSTIALDSAGRVLVAGLQINVGIHSGWISRISPTTGSADASFNAGSPLNVDYPDDSNEGFTQVGEVADGSVLAAGTANGRLALQKVNSIGVGVAGFGTNGTVDSTAIGNISAGSSVSFAQVGATVHVGTTVTDAGGESIRVARLSGNGSVDSSFGTAGVSTIDSGVSNTDLLRDLVADQAGRLLVVGSHRAATGGRDSLLARVAPTGALDTTFGSNGLAISDYAGGARDDLLASGFIRGGKPVAVGNAKLGGGENTLLTLQMKADPVALPAVPQPVDNCTPAKRKLKALTKKLKRQRKALKRAKSSAKRKKLRKQIRKTSKQVRAARMTVRRVCV